MLTGYIKSRATANAELRKTEEAQFELRLNQFDNFTGTELVGGERLLKFDINYLVRTRETLLLELEDIQERAHKDSARVQAQIAEIDAVLGDIIKLNAELVKGAKHETGIDTGENVLSFVSVRKRQPS